MNLIDYNKVLEALDKERQLLLNREQYGAENVLVHHAINVIAELPIVRQPEIVRCKDCKHWIPGTITDKDDFIQPRCKRNGGRWSSDDYCSCAERREK